jgi:dolichyl-phosphate-mannose-protein mannosyltransferase
LRVMPAGIRRSAVRLLAGNRLFAVALIPALLLRVDAELGYRWQSWFNDSFNYVTTAVTMRLDPTRVDGYSVYLWLLSPLHSYALVTISQHIMGLLIAVMIYALARHRFGAPSWVAVLATLPVLYDGFEIQLEHLIMSDTLFLFLVVAAVTLVLWSPRLSWRTCLLAGLLLGLASVVRSTGLPLIAVFAVYLIIRFASGRFASGRRWLSLVAGTAACCVAFAVPTVAYEGWYKIQHGEFTMTDSTGVFLYSRVMTFADCSQLTLSPDLLSLCTTVPPDRRPLAQAYIWSPDSPLNRFPTPKFSPLPNKLAEQFAVKAIEGQPLAYARTIFDDTSRSFDWPRTVFPNADTYNEYLFGYHSLSAPGGHPYGGYSSTAAYYVRGNPETSVVNPFAAAIRLYQRYIWLPGTVYGLILLTGLAGLVLAWRRIGGEALLPWACSVALIVFPAATAEFDYRYVLTAVPLGCLAAAMAFGRDTAGGRWWDRWLARRRGETSGAASLAGGLAGGGLGGSTTDASDDKRDLAPDAS